MKSLLILGYPRSMSTLIYHVARNATKGRLKSLPLSEFHDGDPFNHVQKINSSIKKVFGDKDLRRYNSYKKILDDLSRDHIIKNVNQPLFVSKYLKENPHSYNVLLIERDLAEVVYALDRKGWYWPIEILTKKERVGESRLENLCIAILKFEKLYRDNISKKVLISQKNATVDHKLIPRKLKELGYPARVINYIDDEFISERERCSRYKTNAKYRKIQQFLRKNK